MQHRGSSSSTAPRATASSPRPLCVASMRAAHPGFRLPLDICPRAHALARRGHAWSRAGPARARPAARLKRVQSTRLWLEHRPGWVEHRPGWVEHRPGWVEHRPGGLEQQASETVQAPEQGGLGRISSWAGRGGVWPGSRTNCAGGLRSKGLRRSGANWAEAGWRGMEGVLSWMARHGGGPELDGEAWRGS